MSQANFVNLSAAADSLVNGGIIVPEFQTEIVDLVRRSSALNQRIQYVPAVGSPSRFFEQTAIGAGAFTDPHAINPAATSPTRIEKSVVIKGLTNKIVYSLFDLETVAQQNVFAQLKAKDLKDMVNGVIVKHCQGLWTGADTVAGNQVGAGTSNEYVGIFNQVSNVVTIDTTVNGTSIIDTIRTQVATLLNNSTVDLTGKKMSIYINPLALDALEKEVKNGTSLQRYVETDAEQVAAGLVVDRLRTAAGSLPIIVDPFMKANSLGAAPGSGTNLPFAILIEDLIEYHYIGSKDPRVFQMGKLADLNEVYTAIMFGAPVVKAPAQHIVGNIHVA